MGKSVNERFVALLIRRRLDTHPDRNRTPDIRHIANIIDVSIACLVNSLAPPYWKSHQEMRRLSHEIAKKTGTPLKTRPGNGLSFARTAVWRSELPNKGKGVTEKSLELLQWMSQCALGRAQRGIGKGGRPAPYPNTTTHRAERIMRFSRLSTHRLSYKAYCVWDTDQE